MMNLSKMFVIVILMMTVGSLPALASSVFEDWNDGDLGGWVGNTGLTGVLWMSEGGVDDSGFLFSYEIQNGFNIVGALQNNEPYIGDYGDRHYSLVECRLKFFAGEFTDARFRVRYLDYSHNGWYISLTDDFTPGEWHTVYKVFNPHWSDAEAMAAGWIQEPSSASFEDTMANVLTAEIRVLGAGNLEVGIDNFLLDDEPVSTDIVSWGGVKSLFR